MSEQLLGLMLRFDVDGLTKLWFDEKTPETSREYIKRNVRALCKRGELPQTSSFEEFLKSYYDKRYIEDFPRSTDIQKLLHYSSTGDVLLVRIAIGIIPSCLNLAIYQAAKYEQEEMLDYLYIVDRNNKKSGRVPSIISCAIHTKNMRLLLKYITNDLITEHLDTFLLLSAHEKWNEGVNYFLKIGKVKDLNYVLQKASTMGCLDLVAHCVENGHSCNLNDVLNSSIGSKNVELCKYLILKGAKVTVETLRRTSSCNWIEGAIFLIEMRK